MSDQSIVTTFPEIREPLLNRKHAPGHNRRLTPSPFDTRSCADLDAGWLREDLRAIPDVSEVETVRHFTRLSRLNYGVDHGMYPLGSCTMKHNPKIAEDVASGLAPLHPADTRAMDAVLGHLLTLSRCLEEICGMQASCLWPAAGAHGELTGMFVIRRAIEARGETRRRVLIPDTAHGTNPASCAIAGFKSEPIPTETSGILGAGELARHLDDDVAALMITNPNTLGIFESDISEIARLLHDNGSYLYMDGANMNALIGNARPGDMGVDCLHLNLHKTFGTPHGGGGPGSGPVLVTDELAPYLPVPRIAMDSDGHCRLENDAPQSMGRIHGSLGNTAVLFKALAYILSLGPDGIREASTTACLNAGYLKARLKEHFELPYPVPTLHEFVLSDKQLKARGVSTLDLAKALMDYGFHPSTIYFPLVVSGAIMIEPTETEPLEELDRFVRAMKEIARAARETPEQFADAPRHTPVRRVNEVQAARNLSLTWA